MFWNDPKLYSANIPANYFLPNREIFNYHNPTTMHPYQQFSGFTPYENMLPTQFGYPRFDVPMNFNYPPFMTHGYFDRPQFPFFKPFAW